MTDTEGFDWNETIKMLAKENECEVSEHVDTKAYSFVNRYLHEKQYGIQTAHALARLVWMRKGGIVDHYMNGSQTLVMLSGGGARDLQKLHSNMCYVNRNNFSFDWFIDDDINSLAPSAIAVIPSRKMQHVINEIRSNKKGKLRIGGNLLLDSKGNIMLKLSDNININELMLIKDITNGRTV